MVAPIIWSRTLVFAGLAGMLVGAVDPLEGSFLILASVGLVALGARIGKSRYRVLLYSSLALVALSVAVMVVLSWLGGIGGNTGRSMWWGLLIVPYLIGWMVGLVGAAAALFEGKALSTASGSSR